MTATPESEHRGYRFGEFFVDLDRRCLFRDGEETPLRPLSFQVLCHLVANRGRLVTRDELMRTVWNGRVVTEGSLTQCVIDIRRTIDDADQTMIRTVPRQGYVFDIPVTETTQAAVDSAPTSQPGAGSGLRRHAAPLLLAAALAMMAVMVAVQYRGPQGSDTGVAATVTEKSVAVLPFTDMSPGGDRQYLADGLSEEILALLARSADLKVIARTSSFSLRGRDDLDAVAIGRLLQTRYLLEGSVRHSGEQIRVNARLIGTEDGGEVWSAVYDGEPGDTLRFQTEIAEAVTDALQVALQAAPPARASTEPAAAAYDAYVRGHFFHTRRGDGDLARAKELYLQAIRLEPKYAQPWAGLAGLYLLQLTEEPGQYQVRLELMGNAARTAIALDPELAEGHIRMSQFHALSGEPELRQQHLALAAELNPNSPLILGLQAGRLLREGRYDEAVATQRRAVELDPLGFVARYNLTNMLMLAERYDEAEAELVELRHLHDNDHSLPFLRFEIYLLQGRLDEAERAIGEIPPGLRASQARALLHIARGSRADWQGATGGLTDDESWEAAFYLSELHAFADDSSEALRWLDTSFQRLGSVPVNDKLVTWTIATSASPFLKELRNEPAVQAYLAAGL